MAQMTAPVGVMTPQAASCRLVVRKDKGPAEVVQFVVSGLEMGQQVVVLAGACCLKDLAQSLNQAGLKAESLIRNGRLVYLTAPECLAQLADPDQILQRGPLRRTSSLLRWVTDWSWAYTAGTPTATILGYQRIVHDFVRSLTSVSMCTVHWAQEGRNSLLAMLADHRRAARSTRLQA